MSASSSPSNPSVKSQHHHFVPRFILRHFAHPFQAPQNNQPGKGGGKGDGKRGGKRGGNGKNQGGKNGVRPGEPMLNAIDFSKTMAEIMEIPVARSFGTTDMYRDVAHASNQHYLEQRLSQLEASPGVIVSKFRKNLEEGQKDVCITRTERDTLRKFLFIMKYRNSNSFKRWNHPTAESYSENDRERVLSYMQKKGFTKPMDVWLNNIKAMLDVKIDVDYKWMKDFRQNAYPDDANWFILHERTMYLSLCTPSAESDGEFLLTENSYGIHEGASSMRTDLITGKIAMMAYTEYHVFALITPKLIIVLRSNLSPNPEEDANEEDKLLRAMLRMKYAVPHHDPASAATSLLEDLPVTKATRKGRSLLLHASDKFYFRFFRISTRHVNFINGVFLEESYQVTTEIFKSREAARKALEYYLKNSAMLARTVMPMLLDDARFERLRKLEQAAQLLGSEDPVIYGKLDWQPSHM